MKANNWDDFDYSNDEERNAFEQKQSRKMRKRKWREIENIKEKQRLRRELSNYEHYSL